MEPNNQFSRDMLGGAVSVIIVSWNAKPYLIRTLNSLQRHCSRRMEVIVVDNGSEDGSPEAVERLFPEVRLRQLETNRGFAKANNIGIKESCGEYVCLVNSDVDILDDCIDKACDFMELHPEIGVLGPRVLNPDLSFQSSCRKFPNLWNNFCLAVGLSRLPWKTSFFSAEQMSFFAHDRIRKVDVVSGCFMLLRRKELERVGLLDEDFFIYGEDVDLCKRFWDSGSQVVFYSEAQAIHHRARSAANDPIRFALEQDRAVMLYWRKHHGKMAQFSVRLLLMLRYILRILFWAVVYVFVGPTRRATTSVLTENLARAKAMLASGSKRPTRVNPVIDQ